MESKGVRRPKSIELIGNEVAIRWTDGREDYYPMEVLRACSPSAANIGEKDLFGRTIGGTDQREFPGVRVVDYDLSGTYAVRFIFSDGHQSGLFSFKWLEAIAEVLARGETPDPRTLM